MKVDGACHCGAITYEAEIDPSRAAICHCTDCQVFTGSAFRAIVPASADSFRMKGAPSIYYKTGDSGVRRAQAFCPKCGTSLYSCAADNPTSYNLRLGGLTQRRDIPARKQIWRRSRKRRSSRLRRKALAHPSPDARSAVRGPLPKTVVGYLNPPPSKLAAA